MRESGTKFTWPDNMLGYSPGTRESETKEFPSCQGLLFYSTLTNVWMGVVTPYDPSDTPP